MASFVHLTDARLVGGILRGGLRAGRTRLGTRGVFCVPVVANFQTTFQWLRELKRSGYRVARAVQFRIPDDEMVWVGGYAGQHDAMPAAAAVAVFMAAADPRGLEVIVARGIAAAEISRVRAVPQVTGWRYFPAAKGRDPTWPARGSINARRQRRRLW
jgi:hypothetical protein